MPPLRLKAVCTETGREFGVDDLVCGGYVRDDLYKPIGLYWSVEFQDEAQAAIDSILCQSTGLHDANGKEVFDGDVILVYFEGKYPPNSVYSILFERGGFGLEGFYFAGGESKKQRYRMGFSVLLDAIELDGAKVFLLGNRWEPAETLRQRAEAVSNG